MMLKKMDWGTMSVTIPKALLYVKHNPKSLQQEATPEPPVWKRKKTLRRGKRLTIWASRPF